jgi:predicted nuclease of predicted toxin-antitoxin system
MSEAALRRVLLDENVDRQLVPLFDSAFEVVTVRGRGWAGLKNGELLRVAAAEFDVFVTMDRHLPHQQNLRALDLDVVVVRSVSNAFADVAPLMPQLNAAVREAKAGAATVVAS